MGRLWFLWYLLLMAGGFLLAARLGLQFRHPVAWWMFIPISMGVSLLTVEPIYGSDNATSIIPHPVVIGCYSCFFVFGVFFYQRGLTVRGWWTLAILPSIPAFLAGFYLLVQYLEGFEGVPPDNFMLRDPLTLASALIETALG